MGPSLAARSVEAEFFRKLNQIVEPRVRAGCGSPRLVPGGLVVLETRSRNTGRRSRVPLTALRIKDHVLVSTYRGRRSQWVKNVAADPRVRYWIGGQPRAAKAVALATPDHAPRREQWPRALRWMAPVLAPYLCAGWAFALLGPDDQPPPSSSVRRKRSDPAGPGGHAH
jgi:deazaflavin-dependent oxidoreductase (nitroreductase family)